MALIHRRMDSATSRGMTADFFVALKWKSNKAFQVVIPAQAGIQWAVVIAGRWMRRLDSRLRGNDEIMGLCA